MVEDFGSYLKAERELRGVTLEELHAKTKIPIHFLQALEKNKFDELPEQVFLMVGGIDEVVEKAKKL